MDTEEPNNTRRRFLASMTAIVAALGAGLAAIPFFKSLGPPRGFTDKFNIGRNEWHFIDVSDLEPGEMKVQEVNRKPVYVYHRTEHDLSNQKKVPQNILLDPLLSEDLEPEAAKNFSRSINESYLVVVGLCTHLGCAVKLREKGTVPTPDGSEFQGGFFCPCHGAVFDLSGRVYKGGPAIKNMLVPSYEITEEQVIKIDEYL